MNVKTNYEVAEKIVSIIRNDKYQNWIEFEAEMNKIENSEATKLMIDFYGSFDFSLYKEILYKALNKSSFESDDDFLNMLYSLLSRIIDEKDNLIKKLESIKRYDFTVLERKLKEKLPDDTDLDIEIYFVLDGINAGSIVGKNKMMLNALVWPSSEENINIVEGLLLHEYHHLGLLKWIRKYDESFDKYTDGKGMARYLIFSILSEGSATYFFNEGDDLYPLILESHGVDMANQYKESTSNRAGNIKTNIDILEKDLQSLINFDGDIEEMGEIADKYFFANQTEPLDKAIGHHMCSNIIEKLGLDAMINCFVKPDKFIETYNKSLQDKDPCKISIDLDNLWVK